MTTASEPFHRLTRAAYNRLLGLSKTNPELWTDPEVDFEAHLGGDRFCEPAPGVRLARPVRLRVDDELKQKKRTLPRADQQAWDFYQSLEGMTPSRGRRPVGLGVGLALLVPPVHTGSVSAHSKNPGVP